MRWERFPVQVLLWMKEQIMSASADTSHIRPFNNEDALDREIVDGVTENQHQDILTDADYARVRAIRVEELKQLGVLVECRSCHEYRSDVDTRYSYGIYAGKFCVPCAKRKFRDQCGLTEAGQGDQQDLIDDGEVIDDPDDGESWASHYYDF